MASNLLPTQEGQGPAGPCAFLSVGHVTVARLFFSLFFESVSGSQGGSWDQTVNPLQYSWASLVAQLVKNLPAMQEIWV